MNKIASLSAEKNNVVGKIVQLGKNFFRIVKENKEVLTLVLLMGGATIAKGQSDTIQYELPGDGTLVKNGVVVDASTELDTLPFDTAWKFVQTGGSANAYANSGDCDIKNNDNCSAETNIIVSKQNPSATDGQASYHLEDGNYNIIYGAPVVLGEEGTPLDLLSFSAKVNPDTLEVDWETVNLINVDNTAVQIARDDDTDFTTIAREKYDKDHREPLHHTQKIAINDIMKQLKASGKYQAGKEDYLLRLESTDTDGPVSYSRLVTIHIDQKTGEMTFSIAPSPVSAHRPLHLQLSDDLNPEDIQSIDIFNIIGKQISHFDKLDAVNTDRLTGGTYLIRMTTKGGKVITKKLVV